MNFRPPAVPLFTFDPYFSVWSPADRLTDRDTTHWTGAGNTMLGIATIDGKDYRFMGLGPEPAMTQDSIEIRACSSCYVFSAGGIKLVAVFISPLLMTEDLVLMSRPVGYLSVSFIPIDGADHTVSISVSLSSQFCMDRAGDSPVKTGKRALAPLSAIWMEARDQKPLGRDGDNLRIEWGRLWLAAEDATASTFTRRGVMTAHDNAAADDHVKRADLPKGALDTVDLDFISLRVNLDFENRVEAIFLVGYDDFGKSLLVHGKPCAALWTQRWPTMEDALKSANEDALDILDMCSDFEDELHEEAISVGGEKYADLLDLAYRQSIAAHKLVEDENGELLFVSKECFSNGCAATVDVSYPSCPLFLKEPELVFAMMRPIFNFAESKGWPFDFAPHDAGRYPFVDFQRYSANCETREQLPDAQMPVEECANMIIMEALATRYSGDTSDAQKHLPLLEKWVDYLLANGADPGNQLCTDDFAGHLAHNCNLAIKAIVGIACMGLIYGQLGMKKKATAMKSKAQKLAKDFMDSASNGDGTYRLAFDQPGTTSMKYNAVWDKILGLGLFPESFYAGETHGALRRQKAYGLPLDSRCAYTKSDWLVWVATMAADKDEFEALIKPLWDFYNSTPIRAPMTDWYWTDTATPAGFQARSVVGGFFIKLLMP